jgi:hypothetical protein
MATLLMIFAFLIFYNSKLRKKGKLNASPLLFFWLVAFWFLDFLFGPYASHFFGGGFKVSGFLNLRFIAKVVDRSDCKFT